MQETTTLADTVFGDVVSYAGGTPNALPIPIASIFGFDILTGRFTARLYYSSKCEIFTRRDSHFMKPTISYNTA